MANHLPVRPVVVTIKKVRQQADVLFLVIDDVLDFLICKVIKKSQHSISEDHGVGSSDHMESFRN